jgi:predicted RNA binding protein YcfA (HicA-like mRNA interferase family)
MSKLPNISGEECVKVLVKKGFRVRRQSGSHIILTKENPYHLTVVPNHRELDRGTLRAIIRQTGLSVEEFLELLFPP